MSALETRLQRLEAASGNRVLPARMFIVDGTEAERETAMSQVEAGMAPSEHAVFIVPAVCIGESVSSFRHRVGLSALDMPEWELPRPGEGFIVEIGSTVRG